MRAYVCMCERMYLFICLRSRDHMCMRMWVCTSIGVCVRMCACVREEMCVYVYVSVCERKSEREQGRKRDCSELC